MCLFISWVERDGAVLFLTAYDIFQTRRGEELRNFNPRSEDWIGHGAIKWYYNIKEPVIEKECDNFSSPDNFPKEISQAIKNGEFRGLGIAIELLNKPAMVEYEKIMQLACSEYAKIEQPARVEYEKIKQQACAEYAKIEQPAWDEYAKIRQQAKAEYEKIEQNIFWDLFSVIENRPKDWR